MANGDVVTLSGYASPGDGGHGLLRRNTSLSSFNEGTTYDHNTEVGGWERLQKSPVNVRWFGALGNDTGDQGPAINAAIAYAAEISADWRRAVYFPIGQYTISTALVIPTNGPLNGYIRLFGDDRTFSEIKWSGGATYMCDLTSKLTIFWEHLGFSSTLTTFTLFHISSSFNIDFHACNFVGTHGDSGVSRPNQRCFLFDNNAGDSHLVGCNINNFGVGIETWCIQNYLTDTDISGCKICILGKEGGGLSAVNCTLTGHHDNVSLTGYGVLVDNAGAIFQNQYWFNNCWVEAQNVAVGIGTTANNQSLFMFKWDGGHLAAHHRSIKVFGGGRISFSNCYLAPQMDPDTGTYDPIEVDTTYATKGYIWNCHIDMNGYSTGSVIRQVNSSDVPGTWVVP